MQMFGSSHPPSWTIDEYQPGELSPEDFWEKYVNKREPVILRGETLSWPAHSLWTDEYLASEFAVKRAENCGVGRWSGSWLSVWHPVAEEYGGMKVIIEHKFENAGIDKSKMLLGDYLEQHGKENDGRRYVVSELPFPMYKDVSVPTCLRCGTQYDQLVEMDLWVSNGGEIGSLVTEVPIHSSYDALERQVRPLSCIAIRTIS